MPQLSPPQLQSLAAGAPAPILAALRAQDSQNTAVARALGSALVLGDTLQVLTPYTAAKPLAVPDSWQNLTLANSWVLFGGGNEAQYRIWTDGRVEFRGLIKSGTVNANIHSNALNAPQYETIFAGICNNGTNDVIADVRMESTGFLKLQAGSTNWLSLDNLSYMPASPAPYVPSCFPFDVLWPKTYPPSFVFAQCVDANTANPSNLAAMLVDWVPVMKGNRTFIRVRNIPGLLPSKSYAVTLLAL